MSGCDRFDPRLGAYHDGELGGLERWRMRRHLARCGSCRASLDSLAGVGSWVRSALDGGDEVGTPDVWSAIASQLPVAATPARSTPRRLVPSRFRPGPVGWRLALPAGAGALAAAAVAGVLLLRVGLPNSPGPSEAGSGGEGVVRSLNTHGRPVMVLDGARDDATIIWLMDDGSDQGSEESSRVWI